MNVCIIPARGGSKRIPRKNIKLFHGKPMISWSILAALESKCFDRVIVSTDDQEIAEIAKHYGASVPFQRPGHLADDHAPTQPVIAHAIEELQRQGLPIKNVCCLYSTAPFVRPQDLVQGLSLVSTPDCDFAFSVASFPYPIQRALTIDKSGLVHMVQPDHQLTRSQDLPESFHDAGQFYWGTASSWLSNKKIFSARSAAIVIPRHLVQDIDTAEDWDFAERLFELNLSRK
ncbi:MAG: pseudaminic acid cytidylyltransferase [Bacteriovoracia bacterium]